MDEARRQIAESLSEIEHEVQERLDIRKWISEHPREALLGAFALGFYMGLK